MATSNAIGSNVFDILICLGLPWFLQTAVVSPGSVVRVISKGINRIVNVDMLKIFINITILAVRTYILDAFFIVDNCFSLGCYTLEWLEIGS